MTSYSIKEVFYTIQGEGGLAGSAAVFCRFTGCNMWSGREEHRARDAERNEARCPLWCDTDFRAEQPMIGMVSAEQAADLISVQLRRHDALLVVFTGGEPLLQLDSAFLDAVRSVAGPNVTFAIETNGSVSPKPGVAERLDHICVSPKTRDSLVRLRSGDELKVVVPAYDPQQYMDAAHGFRALYVQPLADGGNLSQSAMADSARFVMEHPAWRLSVQGHKIVGVP